MYYEKQILPLDFEGNFVLAIHFPRHKIGGECTRESSHAFFGHGSSDAPYHLTDITELCCLELKANDQLAREHSETAQVQKEIRQPEQAWMYEYKAQKVLEIQKQVPRTVLATRNGQLFVGIDAEIEDLKAGIATYVQRLIEVDAGILKIDQRELDIITGNSKIYPKAISDDGETIVSMDPGSMRKPVLAEIDLFNYKVVNRLSSYYPVSEIVFFDNHWIVCNDAYIYRIPKGKCKATNKIKIPASVFEWTATPAYRSSLIAFSGDRGLVIVVDIVDGSVKKYFPHRGCKRDDFASIKLSDDGLWLASKLHGQIELVVTSLQSGESWMVAELVDQEITEREEGEYRSVSSIPATFNFIGKKLLVSDSQEVREIRYDRSRRNEIFVSEHGKEGARVSISTDRSLPLDDQINQAKLGRIGDSIRNLHYPACYLISESTKKSGWSLPGEKGAFKLGVSRFGGWPDLPENSKWPVWENRPMAFLGQINLAEISQVQADIRLPKSGLLLFFLGCGTDVFEPELFDQDMYLVDLILDHRNDPANAVQVVYAQEHTHLRRIRYEGKILPALFPPCGVVITKGGLPLPHECTSSYECLPCDDTELDNYNELIDHLATDDCENQFSGYPVVLQSTPLEWGVENLFHGRDQFSIPKNEDMLRSFNRDATRWGMLLQLTSDHNPDFIWGDSGHLYIYGPRAEMEQGNFQNCYANFEN